MLFKLEMCKQVLRGNKTQTRRVAQEGEVLRAYGPVDRNYVEAASGRLKWLEGNTYAVQPERGKKSLGRIRLLSIGRERLQSISDVDCLAEGIYRRGGLDFRYTWCGSTPFSGETTLRKAFEELWDSINTKKGTRWWDDPDVWRLEFEPVESI